MFFGPIHWKLINCPLATCGMVKWFPTRRALTEFCHPIISSTHDSHDKHDVTSWFQGRVPPCRTRHCQYMSVLSVFYGRTLFVWILDIGHIFHSRPQWLNVATTVIGDFRHIATRRAFRHHRRWQCNRAKVLYQYKRWLWPSPKMEIGLSFDAAAADCCCCSTSKWLAPNVAKLSTTAPLTFPLIVLFHLLVMVFDAMRRDPKWLISHVFRRLPRTALGREPNIFTPRTTSGMGQSHWLVFNVCVNCCCFLPQAQHLQIPPLSTAITKPLTAMIDP